MKLLVLCSEALLVLVLLLDRWKSADCYDPLDPNGNITVTIDVRRWTDNGYTARVTIQNYHQYRHIEKPGWALGWTWADKEIILSMAGAVATKQGDCSAYNRAYNQEKVPYSCERGPVIVDRAPDAAGENWTSNCCHGGILSALGVDPPNSFSSFDMNIGSLNRNSGASPPANLTLLAPALGYTCDQFRDVPPTVYSVDGGEREEQALRTWKAACTHSPFAANSTTPSCCVSLSAFYNPEITPCPTCSCDCRNRRCGAGNGVNAVGCTDHMCPVRVHWHVKANYREQWRVKVTISNYRGGHNYSGWDLVVQHPGLAQHARTFSFNSARLTTAGDMGDAVVFWGLDYYNSELPQAGEEGPSFVSSDILVDKGDAFTLNNGWAFPRAIDFNGDRCEMPMPDRFPALPNASSTPPHVPYFLFFLLSLVLLFR